MTRQVIDSAILAAVALAMALGFALGYWAAVARYAPPSCPSEDSCRADYDGPSHSWRIVPAGKDEI